MIMVKKVHPYETQKTIKEGLRQEFSVSQEKKQAPFSRQREKGRG
jgi:hypothetical protein